MLNCEGESAGISKPTYIFISICTCDSQKPAPAWNSCQVPRSEARRRSFSTILHPHFLEGQTVRRREQDRKGLRHTFPGCIVSLRSRFPSPRTSQHTTEPQGMHLYIPYTFPSPTTSSFQSYYATLRLFPKRTQTNEFLM